jgi:two-component system nitrate/nitrite response regulator NarL
MGDRIRIVIADDHPLFREGVRRTLSEFTQCDVVSECASADEAVNAVREHQPDITLLDIGMPGGGIEAARRIAAACPEVRTIMLTVSERESDVINSLKVGASGYVLKGIAGEDFATVIKSVHKGETYVSPSLAGNSQIAEKIQNIGGVSGSLSILTEREEQILLQVAQGLNNKEIACALALSERMVKRYMTNIMRKLKVRNRVEAALKARAINAAT